MFADGQPAGTDDPGANDGAKPRDMTIPPRRLVSAEKRPEDETALRPQVLADFTGQWCVVQDTLECAVDPQAVANGYMQDCETASGTPFQLVASPVQFGGEPSPVRRAPEFNEHADSILATLAMDEDAIIDLKVRGVVA